VREATIETYFRRRVKEAGGLERKFTSPGRRAVTDRIVVFPGGRVSFIELKAPGKKPRADQLREHGRLKRMGCSVLVIDSKELVDAFIKWRTM
jgi:hypothetical protein